MRFKYGLGPLFIFGLALFLRVYFSYPHVLQDGWISYQETDCWLNMRIMTLLAQHFPHMPTFDPYAFYPTGMPVGSTPFFYYLFALVAWVIGLGSPSQHLIEMVGAWLPAILGALVTIPVYLIGKELFGKRAGLIASVLIAILPGQFLWRSTLGFPDYHILEVLLTATALAFLIIALNRSGKQKWICSSLAGISLGLYLLTWTGGVLFVLIIFIAIVLQTIINHLRGKSNVQLCITSIAAFAAALIVVLLGGYGVKAMPVLSLIIGITVFAGAWVLSTTGKKMPRLLYPVLLVLIGLGIAGLLSLIQLRTTTRGDITLLKDLLISLGRFRATGGMLTVAEAKGITIDTIWSYFALCFYIGLAALALVAYQAIKELNAGKILLTIWSIVILVATFQQNRFGYYLAVPIALLTAYMCAKAIEYVHSIVPKGKENRALMRRKGKRKKDKKAVKRRKFNPQLAYSLLSVLIVGLVVFLPNVLLAVDRGRADTGMDADWHSSLVWLRANTPEPLSNSTYTEIVSSDYTYPESSYGVMSWWDYGYWITYVAHRIPNANPGGMGYVDAGLFFTAQSEDEANAILDRLGTRYIIIDAAMATGKFYAMAVWADKNASDYMATYYYSDKDGLLQPTMLLLPVYYQSMCSRLYNFDGKVVTPSQVLAVLAQPQQVQGNTIMVIKDVKQYSTYGEAQAFITSNPNYFIAGQSFSQSIVPLEPLDSYSLVYSNGSIKIFEHAKDQR